MNRVLWHNMMGQQEWYPPTRGFFGVKTARPSTAGWGGRLRVGRSRSREKEQPVWRPRVTKGSAFFKKEKGGSVFRAGSRRVKGFSLVCLCVLVYLCHDLVKSPLPWHETKMSHVQLFSNLEPKLPPASQNSRQHLHQEITKILTECTNECIFLNTGQSREIWEEQVVVILLASPCPAQWPGVMGSGCRNIPVALAPWIICVK